MQLSLTFPTTELQGAYPANAEILFQFLAVDTKFADWITRRINQYGFTLNQDYVIQTTYTGRRPRKEYFITLNMAKELCMVENNDKGKEARQYFIKCEQELQALKFQRYVDEIADLNACLIDKTKRHKREIASYKGKLTIAKNQLAEFNNPKFKPFTSSHLSYMELFKEYVGALGNNNALKIRADGLNTMLKEARNERDYFRNKYNEIYKILKTDKNKEIVLSLAKIQKELEKNYTAIGAVMSFVNDDDRYFLENNEVLKG